MSHAADHDPYNPGILPQAPDNPFRPGSDDPPPTFAGREREMQLLDSMVAPMKEQKPKSLSPILFYGPRGFGKTCLLTEARERYKAERWTVPAPKRRWRDVVRRRPSEVERRIRVVPASAGKDLRSADDAIRVVTGGHPLGNLIGKLTKGRFDAVCKPDEVELSLSGYVSGHYDLSKPPPPHESTALLVRMCRAEPVVMLVDEAHAIDLDAAKILFNIDQDVRQEAPFFLVMSGTPGMLEHFGKANATFVGRSRREPLHGLSLEEAREALVEPFNASQGIEVEPDVVDRVMSESERFPFFVQLWGRDLWNSLKARKGDKVNEKDAATASRSVEIARARYYRDMYKEIEASEEFRHATFAVARALKTAWANGERMNTDDGQRVVRAELAKLPCNGRSLSDRARDMMARIVAADFVWQPDDHLVPGIPTFMSYILDRGVIHDHDPDPSPPRQPGRARDPGGRSRPKHDRGPRPAPVPPGAATRR